MKFKSDPTTLTRRDHFAMAALTGIVSSPLANKSMLTDARQVAIGAYQLADAMEVARNKEGGE